MKKHVVLTLVFASTFSCLSKAQLVQDLYKIYDPVSANLYSSDSTILTQNGVIKPGKPVYNVSVGTGYTTFGKGVGFSTSYISPTVAFSPNQKTTVILGASISYNNFNRMPFQNSISNGNALQSGGNPTQAFAFGQYQVNNKFSVFAMGSFSKNQLYSSPFYQGIGKADYNQLGVGFNYKIGNRMSIGASFNFTNGNNFMGLTPNGFNALNPLIP